MASLAVSATSELRARLVAVCAGGRWRRPACGVGRLHPWLVVRGACSAGSIKNGGTGFFSQEQETRETETRASFFCAIFLTAPPLDPCQSPARATMAEDEKPVAAAAAE